MAQPLSGSQMHQIDPSLRVIAYHELDKYKNIDQLLGPEKAVCILFEDQYNSGHYILVSKRPDNTIEYFDPYVKVVILYK